MTTLRIDRIGMIGFGEVGTIFARDFTAAGVPVSVYDQLLKNEEDTLWKKAADEGLAAFPSMEQIIHGATLVISAVTASSALNVAMEAAAYLRRGQIYLDINSVAPETKMKIAEQIALSGADFVESAVMAPVVGVGIKVPMLLGGTRAATLAELLRALGMVATAVDERIGVASAIKMCRSVMMKGLAALTIESLFAARRYGAEDMVLASFHASYPEMGWDKKLPDILIRRAAAHSARRAAEMREVTQTLVGAGMKPLMAPATAAIQDWLTSEIKQRDLKVRPNEDFSWRDFADETVSKAPVA